MKLVQRSFQLTGTEDLVGIEPTDLSERLVWAATTLLAIISLLWTGFRIEGAHAPIDPLQFSWLWLIGLCALAGLVVILNGIGPSIFRELLLRLLSLGPLQSRPWWGRLATTRDRVKDVSPPGCQSRDSNPMSG